MIYDADEEGAETMINKTERVTLQHRATVVVHHRDGDPNNHEVANLELQCSRHGSTLAPGCSACLTARRESRGF